MASQNETVDVYCQVLRAISRRGEHDVQRPCDDALQVYTSDDDAVEQGTSLFTSSLPATEVDDLCYRSGLLVPRDTCVALVTFAHSRFSASCGDAVIVIDVASRVFNYNVLAGRLALAVSIG